MFCLTQADREYYYKNKELFTHIVSIVCPDDDITPLHEKHIVVKFWDVDHAMTNKFRHYNVVDSETVLNPLWYVKNWYCFSAQDNEQMNLLVHCDAGISRSSAVSLGILCDLSNLIFRNGDDVNMYFREWMAARKEWCVNHVSDHSTGLKRFIEGRLNPGVKPNQAVLKHYREHLSYFPW